MRLTQCKEIIKVILSVLLNSNRVYIVNIAAKHGFLNVVIIFLGVKEFGSDLKKLGLPVEHAPQVSQLMKLGSLNYEDLKQFSVAIEEALFILSAHRDRALHYKMEEVQITVVDELYVEQSAEGLFYPFHYCCTGILMRSLNKK